MISIFVAIGSIGMDQLNIFLLHLSPVPFLSWYSSLLFLLALIYVFLVCLCFLFWECYEISVSFLLFKFVFILINVLVLIFMFVVIFVFVIMLRVFAVLSLFEFFHVYSCSCVGVHTLAFLQDNYIFLFHLFIIGF